MTCKNLKFNLLNIYGRENCQEQRLYRKIMYNLRSGTFSLSLEAFETVRLEEAKAYVRNLLKLYVHNLFFDLTCTVIITRSATL
jgi:hypothetical protein